MERNYGLDRLVAACVCASEGNFYGYNEIKEVLERGDDASFMASEYESMNRECKHAPHKNIRGKEYYSNKSCNTRKKDNEYR